MKPAAGRAAAEAIVRNAMPAALAAKVLSTLRPAVGLRDGRLGAPPVRRGTTRFGGQPDVPSDF